MIYRRYEKIVNMFFVGTSMNFPKMQKVLHFTSILRALSILDWIWPFLVKRHFWTLFRFSANLGGIICGFLDIRGPRCSRTGFYGFWWFMAVFWDFSRFLVPNPQIKNLKIDQKIDFPKIVSKHVLMANMVLKHV